MVDVFVDFIYHRGNDGTLEMLPVLDGVFLNEQATPALPNQVDVIEAQLCPYFIDFIEKVFVSQVLLGNLRVGVVGLVRIEGAQLVVHRYLDVQALLSQLFGRIFPVFMVATGATVEGEQVDVAFALGVGPEVIAVIKRNNLCSCFHTDSLLC